MPRRPSQNRVPGDPRIMQKDWGSRPGTALRKMHDEVRSSEAAAKGRRNGRSAARGDG